MAQLAEVARDPKRAAKLKGALNGDPTGDRVLAAIFATVPSVGIGDTWQLRTLKDARATRPPLQYIVPGISVGSLSIVYGAPGTLKSMLLADLCVCVAMGAPWLSPLPGESGSGLSTLQVPVMWLDFDNGRRRTDERFGS